MHTYESVECIRNVHQDTFLPRQVNTLSPGQHVLLCELGLLTIMMKCPSNSVVCLTQEADRLSSMANACC